MAEDRFGYNPSQLNLMAVRIINSMAEHHPDLAEEMIVHLNVAQGDGATLDLPIQPMSSRVLVAFFVSLVSANNVALTAQLRGLGLEPPAPPDIQPIVPTDP